MHPDNRSIVEDVFHRVVSADPARRGALVNDFCGSDRSLRREIEALLSADESTNRVLDRGAIDVGFCSTAVATTGRTLGAGQRIGSYEIVRLIAGGGMGNVYEAVQQTPRRTVALKLLRAAFASARERRRFLYESELLGRLCHPNIAQVFESGIHESDLISLPFFAMEYVADASTLTDYARARNLSTRERLRLFEKVCDAIHAVRSAPR